jgi:hypothetical protein
MTETVTKTKVVSWGELGWDFVSFVCLLTGAIGIIYGWGYRGIGTEMLVPSFAALILACYSKLESISRQFHD